MPTPQSDTTRNLRHRAEEQTLLNNDQALKIVSYAEMQRSLHELQVHQIELEMQNDEMCRMQHELEVSQTRYVELFDLAPVGYCTLAATGLILEANLTAAALLGADRSSLVKRQISRFILGEDLHIHSMLCSRLVETGESQSCELRMVKTDGTVFWAHLKATVSKNTSSASLQDADDANVFHLILSDISVRKKAELGLKQMLEESQRFRTALDHISGHAYMKDRNFRYVYANQPTLKLFGCSREELVGKDDYCFFASNSAMLTRAVDTRVLAGEQTSEEFETTDAQGVRHVYWSVKTPIYADDDLNEIWGLCGISTDITERKQAESELQKKNAEMEQFIYTVSHDLRSPLVTVKTFMGFLEKDMAEDNQANLVQDIRFIHGAADKMKLLLDELLEMSRIGRVETTPVMVPLREIVADALETLAGVITERKIDIQLPETELILLGDRHRLYQIWQNLIENGIKYSCDDVITRIEIGIRQTSEELVFFVKDNGIGINPKYHSRIFGIFDKLDPRSPGAGLGLSMVQRIVEKNGGRIWVESEGSGSGSCFCFTLPATEVPD
jgi:PAS domain S-box-containing protein